jgi:UDP-N-acetylglucosamine enolpyruvyl transferase
MADTVRNVRIEANITINPDHSIQITGQKSINMTDYHIIPPSFMMGAFKIDRSILLKFNLTAFP